MKITYQIAIIKNIDLLVPNTNSYDKSGDFYTEPYSILDVWYSTSNEEEALVFIENNLYLGDLTILKVYSK